MNLRILKKLSKRAARLLPLVGCDLEPFPAEKQENYHGTHGKHDRKHWERGSSVHGDVFGDQIKWVPRNGNGWAYIRPPSRPLKGTMMVGWMSGYYEPEWDETDAWARLVDIVADHLYWGDCEEGRRTWPERRLRLSTPRDVFLVVPEVIAQRQQEAAKRARYEEEFKAARRLAASPAY